MARDLIQIPNSVAKTLIETDKKVFTLNEKTGNIRNKRAKLIDVDGKTPMCFAYKKDLIFIKS